MLFNSFDFLFYFLPLMLLVYYIGSKYKNPVYVNWLLIIGSFIFYGWNEDNDIPLMMASIGINYYFARKFQKNHIEKKSGLFKIAIIFNLLILIYYKYFKFIITELRSLTNSVLIHPDSQLIPNHLPLAISFFTFQQIAFLVYCYYEPKNKFSFHTYATSVVFFPHLIAGPLVEYKSLIPQFEKLRRAMYLRNYVFLGLFVFIIGLSKKLLVADSLNFMVLELFDRTPTLIESLSSLQTLLGLMAYTFQLYFDFSGYSDMAVGLALFFGIKLPQNFNSPYKSKSLIEFWRNWHISLSSFLRNYLYIPLGGSKNGPTKTYVNLFITMVLGGIWHGAGWNFLIWGIWHGLGLCTNHLLKNIISLPRFIGVVLTFIFVSLGWIFFRAHDFPQASAILKKLLEFFQAGTLEALKNIFANQQIDLFMILITAFIVWAMPNTERLNYIMRKHTLLSLRQNRQSLKFVIFIAALLALLFVICLVRVSSPQAFIYYQF